MRKSSRILALGLGFGALVAGLVGSGTLLATATTSCVVSGVQNSSGKVTFEIRYADNSAGCSWAVPTGVTSIEAAVVGAGGAGGWGNQGGGGGGGEVLHNEAFTVTPGASIPISIGTGGLAPTTTNRPGGNGNSTTFGVIIATGGGGGGGSGPFWQTANMSAVGGAGGSSGGNNIFGTNATLTGAGRATNGAVGNSSFSGWTSYAHRGGSGISNSVAYGSQVAYGAGGGGGGAYEAATDSTAVANGSGGMLTTLGRSGAGIYLMGKCLAGGGESVYRAASGSNTVAGTNFTTANPCKTPAGVVVAGTNSGAFHASSASQYPAANSGGGAAAGTLSGSNDGQAGSNGVVIVSYTVPVPTITSASLTNVQKPTITGTGVDGDTINLSVGGASYTTTVAAGAWAVNLNTATPASGSLALNVNGTNSITSSATDLSGGISANATQTLTIDTTAPATPTFPSTPAITNLNNREIVFASEAGSTAQCLLLSGGTYAPCTSPYSTGLLADGAYTLRVKVTDAAGNTSSIGSYTWTIDTQAPPVPTITTTAAYQTSTSVTANYSATAGTTVTCKLDTNVATSCTTATTMSLTGLSQGSHSFIVYSADAAGNVSSATYSFTVDSIGPDAPIIATSASLTNSLTSTFSFTAEPGSTAVCSINSATYTSCSSPFTTPVLTDGLHTLRVRAIDAAGNIGSIATRTWTLDTVAPAAAVITTHASYFNNSSVTVNFSAEAGNAVLCRIDEDTATNCVGNTSKTYASLSEGAHTFTVVVTDPAGNASTSSYTFTVDTIAPIAPTKANDNSAPRSRTSLTNAVFNFTSAAGTTNQCRLETDQANAFDWSTCSSGYTLTGLALDTYRFSVRSLDAAGNASSTIEYDWEVAPPGPGLPTIAFENNVVTLSGAAGGANGDRYEYKLVDANDNIVVPWGTAQTSFALRHGNGEYQIFARLVDDQSLIGDVVSQAITIANQPNPAAASTPRLNIAATQGYSRDNHLAVTIDWPVGTKSVRVFSTQNNNAGLGQITSLANDWAVSGERRTYNWNFTPTGAPTVTATHTLTTEFLDASNTVINTQTATVIIDVQAPTLSSAIPTAISGTTLPVQIVASDENGGSGLGEVVVSRASGGIQAATAMTFELYTIVNGYVTIPDVTLGETMTIRIRDRVGNESASSFTVAALNRQTLKPTAKFTGMAKVGQTLKLSPGTWPKTHRVTYQWRADGVNIAGATKTTFKLTNAQAGKRISVAVSGARATYYPTVVLTSSSSVVTGGTLTGPTPTFTGTQQVGQTLTANAGTWANGINLAYAWKRGTVIVGRNLTYTLVAADKGKKLTFTVTGTKLGFNALAKTATTGAIKP